MTDNSERVRYLVFDVETVADGQLVSSVKYPEDNLEPDQAIARFRAELIENTGKDVLPPTYMLPIAVSVAKVDEALRLVDLCVLDAPEYRPEQIAQRFWQGWQHYGKPTLVTFNGRGYDLPVLEFAAFRYGLPQPAWFNVDARSYEQSRNRYNTERHIDLQDFFANFGAVRVSGGLNLLARMIGKPGKSGIDGSQVQDMYDAGQVEEINDYCRCDVLDTYFVFLRSRVLTGRLSPRDEHALVAETREWLKQHAESSVAFTGYLENWHDDATPAEQLTTATAK